VVGSFTAGAGFLLRGVRLVTQPGLRRYVVLPLLVNILVFGLLGFFGIQAFDWLLAQLLPTGDAWWVALVRGVLWVFFAAAALIILLFTFSVAANLIASPFNGLLSARVEQHLRGRAPESGRGLLAEASAAIAGEIRKLFYFVMLLLVGFIVTVVPIVNLASPVVWALIAIWMLALEYMAYPMENRGLGFSRVRALARRERGAALGFGSAVMVAMLIPLVNLIVMPAAVAGATAMWVERLAAKEKE